jgi:hypothetical protein
MNLKHKVQQAVISELWVSLRVVWNQISRLVKKWQVWKRQAWHLVQHQQHLEEQRRVLENPERYK